MTSADSRRAGLLTVGVCLAALAGAGCSGGGSTSSAGAGRLVAGYHIGDHNKWRDFDSAVSSALARSEVAVVQREIVSPTQRRWTLRSATDQPGWLLATVPDEADSIRPWDERVAYECRIGRFASPEREAAFIEAVRAWRPKHER